jgi:WD40 repeat protein
MRYCRLGVLTLSLAILALGVLCGRSRTSGKALAADPPAKADPSAKEPASDEGEAISPEQKDKIALVLDNNAHTGQVLGLGFPAGRRELLTASMDCTIRSWDLDTGEPLRVLRPRIGRVTAAAFSRDCNTVALAGMEDKENVVQLIAVEEDRVKSLKGHGNHLLAVALSPDGKWLAGLSHEIKSKESTLWLWDVEKGTVAKKPLSQGSREVGLTFDAEGKKLMLTGDKHPVLPIPDLGKMEPARGPKKEVTALACSPDGKSMALAHPDGVSLIDVKTGDETKLNKLAAHVVAFSADAKKLFFLHGHRPGEGHGARVRDLDKGQEQLFQKTVVFTAGALSPDGTLAAVVGKDSDEIWIYQTADGKELHHLIGHGLAANGVGWSPDGKTLAFNYPPGIREMRNPRALLGGAFSLETMSYLAKTEPDSYQRAQLQRGDLRLELGGQKSREVPVKHGKKKTEVVLKTNLPVTCATFAGPDRAAVGTTGGLELFDATSGSRVCQLVGHDSGVQAVAVSRDDHYLLSAGRDLTLRIWDLQRAKGLDRDKPLLSMFFAGTRTWVAWTPEGYYAASADGDRLVGWQVDNGPGKLASYFPVEQFRKAFYRPDLIKSLLAQGSLEKALWLLDKAREPITVAAVLPPRVTITSPATSGLRLDKPDLTIEAVAEGSGPDPVTALQLLLDGRPYPAETGRKTLENARAGKTAPVSWKVQLPAGRHRLSIEAQTEKSSGNSEELWVTNATPPAQPRLFVLLVGINQYANFNKLNCAVQDAEALEKVFLAHARPPLFAAVQTKLLKDKDATRDGILAGLGWLKDNVKEQDVAVVCYAGHGDTDKGQFHLVTVDATAGKLAETAVSGAELKARLAALKSRRVLMLLDACHSGAIGSDQLELARDLKGSDCGVAVLCAAEEKEVSLESEKEGHGYFTKALLAGLKGDAGKNGAGEITLALLYAFVDARVPEDTQDRQHPVLVGLKCRRRIHDAASRTSNSLIRCANPAGSLTRDPSASSA